MQDWITNLMNSWGYLGIALLMFLENIVPPIPSELIMPLAGFTATGQGKLSLPLVIAAGTIGSLIGQIPLYYIGKLVGEERLKAWADKHGAWLTVSGEEVAHAKKWFDDHGHKSVVFGRLVPGVRSLISIPAGMANMNLAKFLLYSLIGTAAWTALLAYLGSLLGRNYEAVSRYIGPITYVVLGGIALYMVFSVIKRKRAQKNGSGTARTA
ncbi:MAG: DedA family protein [Armatimonadota bacterium]